MGRLEADGSVKTRQPWLILAALWGLGACVSLDRPIAVKSCAARADCRDVSSQAPGGKTSTGGTRPTGGAVAATGGITTTGGSFVTAGATAGAGGTVATGGLATTEGETHATGGNTDNAGSDSAETGGMTAQTGGTTAATGGALTTAGSNLTTAGTSATGGATATAGITAATGGASATGGSIAVTAGTPAMGGATAGTTRTAGDTATGGASATGGTTSAAGGVTATSGSTAGGTSTSPPPAITLPGTACTSESKDAACTGSAVCARFCGPDSQGYKTLTCNGSKYVEGACTFSSTTSYACYSVAAVSLCPSTPTASTSCALDPCRPCGGSSGTTYYDSGGNEKTGYCVCTNGRWSCASTSAWPCPGRTGC
jgi:hypothetical protein